MTAPRKPLPHRAYLGTSRLPQGYHLPLGNRVVPKPNRLAVLPDPDRTHPRQYAIVTRKPLHHRHGLVGYQRGFGERYAGLWAYRFVHWMTAARVAHDVANGTVVFAEDSE